MKKIITILLAIGLLTGCKGDKPDKKAEPAPKAEAAGKEKADDKAAGEEAGQESSDPSPPAVVEKSDPKAREKRLSEAKASAAAAARKPADKPEKGHGAASDDQTMPEDTRPSAKDTAAPADEKAAPVKEPGKAEAAKRDKSRDVVARKGDVVITRKDLADYLKTLPPFQRRQFATKEKKRTLLKNFILLDTLAREARAKGYDKDSRVQFLFKTEMVKAYLSDRFGEDNLPSVTDDEVRAQYEKDHARYNKPERVRASQILIKDQAKAARVLAGLRKQMSQPGARVRKIFREAVKEHSEDQESRRRGGDLLFMTRAGYPSGARTQPQPVIDAAFAMQNTNQISRLVRSEKGYHILLLTNRRPAESRSLDEVKDRIRNSLAREKMETARKAYLEGLGKMEDWSIDGDSLSQLQVDDAPDPHAVKARVKGTPVAPDDAEKNSKKEPAK